jgi:hypothetical protein
MLRPSCLKETFEDTKSVGNQKSKLEEEQNNDQKKKDKRTQQYKRLYRNTAVQKTIQKHRSTKDYTETQQYKRLYRNTAVQKTIQKHSSTKDYTEHVILHKLKLQVNDTYSGFFSMCNFSFALAFRPVWLKSRENLF